MKVRARPHKTGPTLSLRAKLLLSAVLGATVPLAITGTWLAYATRNGAIDLLRSQLDQELDEVSAEIGERWVHRRSELLLLARNEAVRSALESGGDSVEAAALRYLRLAYQAMDPSVDHAVIRDSRSGPKWVLYRSPLDEAVVESAGTSAALEVEPAGAGLRVRLPIPDSSGRGEVGWLEARISSAYLLPPGRIHAPDRRPILAATDRGTGRPVLSSHPLEDQALSGGSLRLDVRDTIWLVARRSLAEPALDLAVASPLEPYVGPFRRTSRAGLLILLVVGVFGIGLAVLVGRYLSRSLNLLVTAAEAVSNGDLDQTVKETSTRDEVGRLALAFNKMTASLRTMLAEAARRESVSAVGDFAYGVAHEVRNPLTSLRLDLEIAEEKLPPGARSHAPLRRALQTVDRLERTVTGVLGLARSGRVELRPIDLDAVLRSAAARVETEFTGRGASLQLRLPGSPLEMSGDAEALDRLFCNLLVNSAHALDRGGIASLEVEQAMGRIRVIIRDDGCGIPAGQLARVFDPFYSVAPGGTGLGLPISMQIARAHGGGIEIESAPGKGTVVRVTLEVSAM